MHPFLATEPTTVWVILLALVAGLPLTLVPLSTRRMDNKREQQKETQAAQIRAEERQERKEVSEEAYRQQKAVADEAKAVVTQAAEAAKLLADRQDESDRQLGEVARKAAEAQKQQIEQLSDLKVVADQTHVLVNSNMMRELRKGLAGMKAQKILADRLMDMNEKMGIVTTEEDIEALSVLKAEIIDSEKTLIELIARTRVAEEIGEAGGLPSDEKTKQGVKDAEKEVKDV